MNVEWINVKDRLPNCNGCYIVFIPNYYDEDHGVVKVCYFDGTDTWHNDYKVNFENDYIVKVDGKEILSLEEKEAAVQIMNDNLLEMENESAYEITKFLKDNDADLHSVFTKEDLNGYCIKIVITKNKDTGYDLGGCEINEKR